MKNFANLKCAHLTIINTTIKNYSNNRFSAFWMPEFVKLVTKSWLEPLIEIDMPKFVIAFLWQENFYQKDKSIEQVNAKNSIMM